MGILTNHDAIRHSSFEGNPPLPPEASLCSSHAASIIFSPPDHTVDFEALTDLVESFSFSEVRKCTLDESRFCSVLCDTTNDQGALFNCGGIIMSWGQWPST